MGLSLNVSFLDRQHSRYFVESNTDPKCYLEFSWLMIPRVPAFSQLTFSTLKVR